MDIKSRNRDTQVSPRVTTTKGVKGRTIVVGDLHGCLSEARELLRRCKVGKDDTVIFLGDLVDRGKDPVGCLDLARQLEQDQGSPSCILGNHEEKYQRYRTKELRGEDMRTTGSASHDYTRSQLKPEHYAYMEKMPHVIRLPDNNSACVHAGVWPNRPLEEQNVHHLLHIQMIKPYDQHSSNRHDETTKWPSKAGHGWVFWSQVWHGTERILFGHSVLNKPLVTPNAVGLDGGGCFGRELWALILPENRIVAQPCPDYAGNDRRSRKLCYEIADGVGAFS